MMFSNIAKRVFLTLFGVGILTQYITAKDPNILAYVDRGIKYYPRYVPRGLVKYGKASWYGKRFHRKLTASGERYNMYRMTAAHRTYALNTILRVTNLENKKSVIVKVNDRGPFYRSRDIDLSYGAAKKIGLTKKGVGRVKIEVIRSPKRIKRYKKSKRRVSKSKGNKKYIVQVASFFDKKYAKLFKKKHKLKNAKIVPTYIKSKRKTAYRVIVKCTPWEAKKILKSKKFNGAYLIS
jgi:rare lipoprotein A